MEAKDKRKTDETGRSGRETHTHTCIPTPIEGLTGRSNGLYFSRNLVSKALERPAAIAATSDR